MTKFRLVLAGATVVLLGLGATAGILRTIDHEKATDSDPATEATAIQVKIVHPRKGALERLCVQPGSVQAFESVRLFAKVPGFLDSQTVDIGSRVKGPVRDPSGAITKEGDVLAKVYVPDIEANVERNAAAVKRTQAKLIQMKARVDVAKANLDAVKAAVPQAEAKVKADSAWVKYRKIQHGRMEELALNTVIEQRIVDESRERLDSAIESENASRAAVITTRANVVSSKAKIEETEADVLEAEESIKLAQAELKRSNVDLGFATIRAPFDGVITHRGMYPGDFVKAADGSPNIEPLFTIDRADLFRVVVLLPERDVRFIRDGTQAAIELDALPGSKFPLKVARFANSLDKRTRLMRIEFDLKNNPKGQIYNDMYGQVTIVLERGTDLLSVPSSCLASKAENGKATVFVVRSGRAEKIEVRLGMDSGVRVAVLEGLTTDDQVILNPNSSMSERPAVTPVHTRE